MIELAPRYEPKQIEESIYRFWVDGKYFHPDPSQPGETYTIVIPPPNVTGVLHMGHALNNTLQDILIRWRRMQGFNTLWLPGTDHAGIATQNVVEQRLADEGLHRRDLGREKFVERVWQWNAQYGNTIIGQLKRLGCSCDWDRQRFTLDEGLSRAVLETFIALYERGLIYRGKYIINWCPRCQTALSDDEVEHEEHQGHLWRIRYALKDSPGNYVTVATTRPETMLGDTAVAVHPADERYRQLVGKTLVLPMLERPIPIVADNWVDPQFGTGAVKVTPAHDPNDFEIARRHSLPSIVAIDEEGKMTLAAGDQYEGMDRFECRAALVEDLREREQVDQPQPYVHSVGHCYRCHTVIEPYLSDQWFVKMRPLAEKAMEATRDGRVKFHPERWEGVYLSWLENVRDWCVSRQIWWGHRLPVYYCGSCKAVTVARQKPERCAKCGSTELRQDDDVLDTWFSSSLWPFSTLGWPEQTADLKRYYPTDTLVTARDIIYFWVARMVMMGLEFTGRAPFSDVFINGTVLDEQGRRMSKSAGNGIDPLEMIEIYGADAVRFSLVLLTTEGQDIKLSVSKFEMGRNFANKVWNASRFVLMNLGKMPGGEAATAAGRAAAARRFEDKWILSRLTATETSLSEHLESFRTNEAAQAIYDFFWHDFCDWYVEAAKFRLRENNDAADALAAADTLVRVLDRSLRLLHPFAPFLTEEIWQKVKAAAIESRLPAAADMTAPALIVGKWPTPDAALRSEEAEQHMQFVQDIVRAVRHLRKEKNVADTVHVDITIACPDAETETTVAAHAEFLTRIAGLKTLAHGVDIAKPPHSATTVVGTTEVFLGLAGIVDLSVERDRLEKQKLDVSEHIRKIEKQLHNPEFLAHAPQEVVQRQMDRAEELRERLRKVIQNLAELG